MPANLCVKWSQSQQDTNKDFKHFTSLKLPKYNVDL